MPEEIKFDDLRLRHQAVLFDAYGVLVDASGARPGAAAAVATLRRAGQPFLVVTNDASRSPEHAAARLGRLGIDAEPEHILSSGMMIAPALREMEREDLRVVVLGTEDSAEYARAPGVHVVAPTVMNPADVVVIADEGGPETLAIMDDVLSMIIASVRDGMTPRLLLANPDLIYPSGADSFGFTAGALALMLERALELVLGNRAPTFEALGKPSPRIFLEALARVGVSDAVMIGDQLHTDIAGAHSVGMAAALLLGGVSHNRMNEEWGDWTPRYLLKSL
ncbi:MAG: HAD-IA family hydrolase [Phycisphaerae bacterium]|nr:HAD-IA family hydrolase [Gemmatimonadaceae bacterium]